MITAKNFKKEVKLLAKEIRVNPKEIHIRKMKRKWASCSSKGRITFSRELLTKPKKERVKVIIHELLHLRYKNHNRLFDSLIKAYLVRLKS